ncbi:G2-specific serine/threonine protein kinase [Agyrium rufum]|nr:G2-specific serine/threonine protein kinase [Agyrium rufum]
MASTSIQESQSAGSSPAIIWPPLSRFAPSEDTDHSAMSIKNAGLEGYRYIKDMDAGAQGSVAMVQSLINGNVLIAKSFYKPMTEDTPIDSEVRCLVHHLSHHPNIVVLQEIIGYPFQPPQPLRLLYNFCSGGDLWGVLDKYMLHKCALPEAFIWHVFLQLSEAVAYLHSGYDPLTQKTDPDWLPVLHRDIKPENIFLQQESHGYPRVILGDFGLVGFPADPDHETRFVLGPREYRGPEMTDVTAASDVWAIGAVIHTMIHDDYPIIDALSDVPESVWRARPESRRHFPAVLKYSDMLQVRMRRCLENDPADRITSAQLASALRVEASTYAGRYTALKDWAMPAVIDHAWTEASSSDDAESV